MKKKIDRYLHIINTKLEGLILIGSLLIFAMILLHRLDKIPDTLFNIFN